MSYRKPLVLNNGQLEQVQTGDGLDAGAYQLPSSAGTAGQNLAIPANGTVLEWVDSNIEAATLVNDNAANLTICQPVYIKSNGAVDLAQADASATSEVFGLVNDALIAPNASGRILFDAVLTATTGEWDAVTGGSGGLTPGETYFLDAATVGMLTINAPTASGEFVVNIGRAISATKLDLTILAPIKL